MYLAHPNDVRRYVDLPNGDLSSLQSASDWVESRVALNGRIPDAVREATALLAAVYHCDPDSRTDDSRVPNMVRVMLVPWSRPLGYPRD